MWKMSLPPGVVVSICSCRLRKPMVRCCRSVFVSIKWGSERPSRSNFQTTDSVARLLVEDLCQLRSLVEGAGGRVGEDPIAAGVLERVELEVGMLVGCRTRA